MPKEEGINWTSLVAGRSSPLCQNPRENPGPDCQEMSVKIVRGLVVMGTRMDQIIGASALTAKKYITF